MSFIPPKDIEELEKKLKEYGITLKEIQGFIPTLLEDWRNVNTFMSLLEYDRFRSLFEEVKKKGIDTRLFWEAVADVFAWDVNFDELVDYVRETLGLRKPLEEEMESFRKYVHDVIEDLARSVGKENLALVLYDVLRSLNILKKIEEKYEKIVEREKRRYAGKLGAVGRKYRRIIDELEKRIKELEKRLGIYAGEQVRLTKWMKKEEREVKKLEEKRDRLVDRIKKEMKPKPKEIDMIVSEISKLLRITESEVNNIFRSWLWDVKYARLLLDILKDYSKTLESLRRVSGKYYMELLREIGRMYTLLPEAKLRAMIRDIVEGYVTEARLEQLKSALESQIKSPAVTLREVVTNEELYGKLLTSHPRIAEEIKKYPPEMLELFLWVPDTDMFFEASYKYDKRRGAIVLKFNQLSWKTLLKRLKERGKIPEEVKEKAEKAEEVPPKEYRDFVKRMFEVMGIEVPWRAKEFMGIPIELLPPAWRAWMFEKYVRGVPFRFEDELEFCGITKGTPLDEFIRKFTVCKGFPPPDYIISYAKKLGYIREI